MYKALEGEAPRREGHFQTPHHTGLQVQVLNVGYILGVFMIPAIQVKVQTNAIMSLLGGLRYWYFLKAAG